MPVYTLFKADNTVEVLEISKNDQKPDRILEYFKQYIADEWLEINARFRVDNQAATIFMADNPAGRASNERLNALLTKSAKNSNYNRGYLDSHENIDLKGDIVVKTSKPIPDSLGKPYNGL